MRMPVLAKSQRTVFAPITYAQKHPRLLGQLVSPMLITSIGAGLVMPFMNKGSVLDIIRDRVRRIDQSKSKELPLTVSFCL